MDGVCLSVPWFVLYFLPLSVKFVFLFFGVLAGIDFLCSAFVWRGGEGGVRL